MSHSLAILQAKYQKSSLSPSEAAAELSISVEDLLAAVADSTIPARRIGLSVTFPLSSLAAFLDGDAAVSQPTDFFQESIDSPPIPELSYHTPNGEEDNDMMSVKRPRTGYVGYHKKSCKWYYQIGLGKDESGNRIRETKTFPTEAEANQAVEARLLELNANLPPIVPKEEKFSGNTLYGTYLEYMLTKKLINCSSTTQKGYSYSIQALITGLGDFQLKELTDTLFTQFFNVYCKTYKQPTIDRVYILAKKSMKLAEKEGILPTNILDEFKKPKTLLPVQDKDKSYSTNELKHILTRAKEYPELYPILRVFNCTGMRPGELQALTWNNVKLDADNPSVKITSAAIKNWDTKTWTAKAPTIGPTKTPYSVRPLPLDQETVSALKEWRHYLQTTSRYRFAVNSEFVFPMPDGNFISHDALRLRFNRFLEKEDLKGRGYCLYHFRHTVCTNLFRQKVDVSTVMRFMGDNTPDVIMKTYRQVNGEDIRNAGQALSAAYKDI